MKEELVLFETAKLAKEKGFDVFCYQYYYESNSVHNAEELADVWMSSGSSTDTDVPMYLSEFLENHNRYDYVSAPTQSLLQRWLREEHNTFVEVVSHTNQDEDHTVIEELLNDLKYCVDVDCYNGNTELSEDSDYYKQDFNTYEEALEKGLFEALKLI